MKTTGIKEKTLITVIRHGETEWNRKGIPQGHLDSPLTREGRKQASAAAAALQSGYDVLLSSSLGRAVITAEIIGEKLGLPVIEEDNLRERNLGILQGLTMDEFRASYPSDHKQFRSLNPDYVIPGGESIRQRFERAVWAFNAVAAAHRGKKVLVVTHGGIMLSLFMHTVGIPVDTPRRFSLVNGSINRFSHQEEWFLESWGETRHLGAITGSGYQGQ